MSKEREALKLALEAAEGIASCDWRKWEELASPEEFERWVKSRAMHMATALREALAEQPAQQEPVAWIFKPNMELLWPDEIEVKEPSKSKGYKPLYTAPPAQRKPLTDEEIKTMWRCSKIYGTNEEKALALARAIEAAHGIKEKNT